MYCVMVFSVRYGVVALNPTLRPFDRLCKQHHLSLFLFFHARSKIYKSGKHAVDAWGYIHCLRRIHIHGLGLPAGYRNTVPRHWRPARGLVPGRPAARGARRPQVRMLSMTSLSLRDHVIMWTCH
jgi:hypothetical protein